MAKRIVQLSDTKVRNAKPRKTEYKLFDGGGLYLEILSIVVGESFGRILPVPPLRSLCGLVC